MTFEAHQETCALYLTKKVRKKMVAIKPLDEVPGSSGNDVVTDQHMDNIFDGQPLDVWNYLQIPGNVVDDTQVIYSMQAPAPFGGTIDFATNYLTNFSMVYPDITLPS